VHSPTGLEGKFCELRHYKVLREGVELLHQEVSQRPLLLGLLGDERTKPGKVEHLALRVVSLYQPAEQDSKGGRGTASNRRERALSQPTGAEDRLAAPPKGSPEDQVDAINSAR
jgi:hypothetical protein